MIVETCEHIIKNCASVEVCNDATTIRAMAALQQGKAAEVIETLEAVMDPKRIANQNEMILIQAYHLAEKPAKARSYTQITMYLHVVGLIGNVMQYLALNGDNLAVCDETIRRSRELIATYAVDRLHPGLVAQFHFQSALLFLQFGKEPEGLPCEG